MEPNQNNKRKKKINLTQEFIKYKRFKRKLYYLKKHHKNQLDEFSDFINRLRNIK